MVVLIGTKGHPTDESEQGHLLGIMEPTIEAVMALDFVQPRDSGDYGEDGKYKWPYGLLNRRSWKFIDRTELTPEISQRKFNMDAAQGIVELTTDEAKRVARLKREEVPLLAPTMSARIRMEGVGKARKRASPPPTTTRRGVMHMRRAPAFTYALKINGSKIPAFKIGWAFDYKQRADQFNHASMPALGGLEYVPKLNQPWDTAKQAYRMEQGILEHFDGKRHVDNHEVLVGLEYDELWACWRELVLRGKT
ncbi:MAG: hypothetical protein ACWA5L_03220 [bacterium]